MSFLSQDSGQRQQMLGSVKRVVLKVGTRLLTDIAGIPMGQRVDELVARIAGLRERGLEVILVTSGAIGAGMTILETSRRPRRIPELQAHAAVGQCRLMYLYETACERHGFHCAQLLLTAADVRDHERHLNISTCLNELLARQVLPVINENDSVGIDEIKFGDNDTLAALVANMARADLTVLLTTIDGMRERTATGLGTRLSVVPRITPKIKGMATGTDGNALSTGGMITKLKAAEMVTKAGEALWIADGHDFGVLGQLFDGADLGTLFLPAEGARLSAHKRFLAFFSPPAGELLVDAGAEQALCEKGRSLLPSGICEVRGVFKKGATVTIVGPAGNEIARGLTNFATTEIDRIKGRKTDEIEQIPGCENYAEVVHRDHLVLTRSLADAPH